MRSPAQSGELSSHRFIRGSFMDGGCGFWTKKAAEITPRPLEVGVYSQMGQLGKVPSSRSTRGCERKRLGKIHRGPLKWVLFFANPVVGQGSEPARWCADDGLWTKKIAEKTPVPLEVGVFFRIW